MRHLPQTEEGVNDEPSVGDWLEEPGQQSVLNAHGVS